MIGIIQASSRAVIPAAKGMVREFSTHGGDKTKKFVRRAGGTLAAGITSLVYGNYRLSDQCRIRDLERVCSRGGLMGRTFKLLGGDMVEDRLTGKKYLVTVLPDYCMVTVTRL